MADLWWSIRFHVLRATVSNAVWFAVAIKDGVGGFGRAFARTWSERWRASDADEFKRRYFTQQSNTGEQDDNPGTEQGESR